MCNFSTVGTNRVAGFIKKLAIEATRADPGAIRIVLQLIRNMMARYSACSAMLDATERIPKSKLNVPHLNAVFVNVNHHHGRIEPMDACTLWDFTIIIIFNLIIIIIVIVIVIFIIHHTSSLGIDMWRYPIFCNFCFSIPMSKDY